MGGWTAGCGPSDAVWVWETVAAAGGRAAACSMSKSEITCGLPLSNSSKSSLRKFPTAWPAESRTTTRASTRPTFTLNVVTWSGLETVASSLTAISAEDCCSGRLSEGVRACCPPEAWPLSSQGERKKIRLNITTTQPHRVLAQEERRVTCHRLFIQHP